MSSNNANGSKLICIDKVCDGLAAVFCTPGLASACPTANSRCKPPPTSASAIIVRGVGSCFVRQRVDCAAMLQRYQYFIKGTQTC